jgi:ribosome-associated toxin RatA of RatAB toxin-antitoxin module
MMRKFKTWEETIDYLNEIKIESEYWYAIRNNIYNWNIKPFTEDSTGIEILIKYLKSGEDIEEKSKEFFEKIIDKVILGNLKEYEVKLTYEIAEKSFKDGLLTFDKNYILKIISEKDLQQLELKNILIYEEEKYRFQNILIQTYLAARRIISKDEKINSELFLPWYEDAEDEYLNSESEILYIFSMINIEKFNKEYLKENLEEFLSKINTNDKFTIAQSIIDIFEIVHEMKEYSNFLKTQSDYDMFLKFLDVQIVYDIVETDFSDYESMLKLKFLNQNGNIEIIYEDMKNDKFLAKMLDECGVIDVLVEDFKKLKKIYSSILKNPKKDYCEDWEIKNINL